MVSGSDLVSGKVLSCGCVSNNRKRQWELKNPDIPYDFRKYIVYKHTSPNSKVYIGVTMQDPSKRWQNGLGYETQTYFYRAIKKYGWESFEHEILESDLSMKEALSKEKEYISLYDSRNPEHGYNILEGGQGGRFIVNPVIQYYYDQEVNFFESIAHAAEEMGVSEGTIRNYINSDDLPDGYRFETLPRMSKYEIDPSCYEVRDESHYQIASLMKIRKREKTIRRNKETRRAVNQYKLDGTYIKTWDSIKEAMESLPGLGSLSASLRNRTNSKTAGGFQWRYDDGNHQSISPVDLKNRRPVVQIDGDTGKRINCFPSAAEASRATGVGKNQIYKSCKGICKRGGGFVWEYAE